jgi:tetratricopeptide (TPR) repeat protein
MNPHSEGGKTIFFFFLAAFFVIILLSTIFLYVLGSLWQITDLRFGRGDYPGAIRTLGYIALIDRHDIRAYQLKAWLQWSDAVEKSRRGEPYQLEIDAAIATLHSGKRVNPYAWELALEEGQIWECFGDMEKAALCYQEVFAYAPIPYSRLYPQTLKKCGKLKEACDAMASICADRNDRTSGVQLEELKNATAGQSTKEQ